MTQSHPFNKIRERWQEINSLAGVGIDPDIEKIPHEVWDSVGGKKNITEGFFKFSKEIIDSTASLAVDYKINSNFFSGVQERKALEKIFDYIKRKYPKVLRVYDGKFADIGNTAGKLVEYVFDHLDADAVLLNPYMGFDAIEPFTSRADKISIICINTSNPSANDVQSLTVKGNKPLWVYLLEKSMKDWNEHGNIIPVLSATNPNMFETVREIVGDTPILLAGIGSQGGSLSQSVPYLLDSNDYGLMISSSRAILYAEREDNETIGDAAKRELIKLRDEINTVKANAK